VKKQAEKKRREKKLKKKGNAKEASRVERGFDREKSHAEGPEAACCESQKE